VKENEFMRELINRYDNCYPLEDNYNNDLGPMTSLFCSWQTSNVCKGERVDKTWWEHMLLEF